MVQNSSWQARSLLCQSVRKEKVPTRCCRPKTRFAHYHTVHRRGRAQELRPRKRRQSSLKSFRTPCKLSLAKLKICRLGGISRLLQTLRGSPWTRRKTPSKRIVRLKKCSRKS